jgi:sterol desaturase/sphingolipid hydroxylase (fatty acid hydroxylase superfamily)
MQRLFPRSVFLHPSARLDYALFLINDGALFFVSTSAIVSAPLVAQAALGLLPFPLQLQPPGPFAGVAYSLLLMLVWDFAATYAHYLKHRVPILWEFHKVHHSAEVLTPVTALRRHPVEDLFSSLLVAVLLGLASAFWLIVTRQSVAPATIFGALAGVWMWRLLGYNLRHSHIWVDYGPFWSRLFISPAQHQIHHSDRAEHYDKNFGHIFAIWDTMLGTLYVPQRHERITLGIDAHEMDDYRTVRQALIAPFVKSVRLMRAPKPDGAG